VRCCAAQYVYVLVLDNHVACQQEGMSYLEYVSCSIGVLEATYSNRSSACRHDKYSNQAHVASSFAGARLSPSGPSISFNSPGAQYNALIPWRALPLVHKDTYFPQTSLLFTFIMALHVATVLHSTLTSATARNEDQL